MSEKNVDIKDVFGEFKSDDNLSDEVIENWGVTFCSLSDKLPLDDPKVT